MKTSTSKFLLLIAAITGSSVSFAQLSHCVFSTKMTKDKMASLVQDAHDKANGVTRPAVWMGHVAERNGGPAVTPLACDTVTSTFAGGNGHDGNMFDVTAINAVTITAFAGHFDPASASSGYVKVFYKNGSYMGSETTPGAWTLIDSAMVTGMGANTATPIPININKSIAAGQTMAFYITGTGAMTVSYTNGTTEGAVYASDANLQFLEGKGVAYPFGSNFTPRVWNGMIFYCTGATGIDNVQSVSTSLSPNPFSDAAVLSFGKTVSNAEVHVFDMIGKEVKRVDAANASSVVLSREGLNAGVYFVHVIESGKVLSVQKVVIQ